MKIAIWVALLGCCQIGWAAHADELIFADSNYTYGLFVTNDRHGQAFVKYFNESLGSQFNGTFRAGIWDVRLINFYKAFEEPNFFVFDSNRAAAMRYLGYFQAGQNEPNLNVTQALISLLNTSHHAIPAEPEIRASRTFNRFIYGIFLPIASFSFWQLIGYFMPDCGMRIYAEH